MHQLTPNNVLFISAESVVLHQNDNHSIVGIYLLSTYVAKVCRLVRKQADVIRAITVFHNMSKYLNNRFMMIDKAVSITAVLSESAVYERIVPRLF